LMKESSSSYTATLARKRRPNMMAGRVDDDTVLEHMLLQLRRPTEKEEDLQEFLRDLQTVGSRNYHRWISAREFGERFGPSDRDLDKLTDWLERHHLPNQRGSTPAAWVIDFTAPRDKCEKPSHGNPSFSRPRPEAHRQYQQPRRSPGRSLIAGGGHRVVARFLAARMHQMHQARHQFTVPNPLGGTILRWCRQTSPIFTI